MIFVLILILYLGIGAADVRPSWRRGHRGEAAVAAAITGLGLFYTIGLVSGWPLPNPVNWLTAVFRPVAVLFGAL